MIWQESEAAERFDDLLDAALNKGEQTISRADVQVAVFVSFKDWKNLNAKALISEQEVSSQRKP